MIDLMLDLETLGKGPGFAVLSAAIVPFNINGKQLEVDTPTFNHTISIGDSMAIGMAIDNETLEWWMQNDPDVIRSQFKGELTNEEFAIALTNYIGSIEITHGHYRLWASAPKLDFGCLYYQFLKVGMPYPVVYSAERCYRTIREQAKRLCPGIEKRFKLPRVNHDAEADCLQQITKLQGYYAAISGTEDILAGRLKEDVLEDVILSMEPAHNQAAPL